MENRIGARIPSEQDIAALLQDIASIKTRIAKWGLHLSSEERASSAKLRLGADELVPRLNELAKKHGVQIKGLPLEDMNADFMLLRRIKPIEQALGELSQLVADSRLEASSEAAHVFYAYYSRLSQMAERDAELEQALAPLSTLMSRRRHPR